MATTKIHREKIRVDKLKDIIFWIEEARIKIGVQQFNLSCSNIAGEGIKYSNRIEILEQAIKRLDVRYFRALNG